MTKFRTWLIRGPLVWLIHATVGNSRDHAVVLPHGPNCLFVDRTIAIDADNRSVTCELDYFAGCRLWPYLVDHVPGNVIFPGVNMIEMINQTAAQLGQELPEFQGKFVYFAGTEKSRIRKAVRPPAVLRATAKIVGDIRHNIGTAEGYVQVDGVTVAEATIKFAISAAQSP